MNDQIFTKPGGGKSPSQSTIWGVSIRGWIVVVVILTVCIMSMGGLTVVEPLYTIAISVVSFYFGQNAKQNLNKEPNNNEKSNSPQP